MRRKEREITDPETMEAILHEALLGHMGLVDEGRPFVVPVYFAYDGRDLCVHSAPEGRKIGILRKNPDVFFETETGMEIVPGKTACAFGSRYRSVMIEGRARIVTEEAEKIPALDAIMEKYSGRKGHSYPSAELARIVIIKIRPERMTGKRS